MRYVISTTDSEGIIGIQLGNWQKEGKIEIIEKAETLVQIEANLARVASALEILRKAGYNSEVMQIFLQKRTGFSATAVKSILYAQRDFLKQIGAIK